MYTKYPRTPHLPWSEGATSDDVFLIDDSVFVGKQVVVTEKLDGECTSMYRDKIHARSLDSKNHPSRHLVKALWAQIKNDIYPHLRIVGENCAAKHSIFYDRLPSVFSVFAIYDGDYCLPWYDTEEWCKILGLKTVPVLYTGIWNKDKVKACFTGKSRYGDIQEGYVVRINGQFHNSEFSKNVTKFVRKNHVQTSEHWMQEKIIPNNIIGVIC